MPKLWVDTIEAHRREVTDAIVGTTADLVSEHGLATVTMSQIAEKTGIGRATLYKYFRDVEEILVAWHERQVSHHLERLAAVRDRHRAPGKRLEAVLREYANISHLRERAHQHRHRGDHRHGPHSADVAAFVHHGEHFTSVQERVIDLFRDLLVDAMRSREVRDDIAASELATYCVNSLGAASGLSSDAAVERLVSLTLSGLSPRARRADR